MENVQSCSKYFFNCTENYRQLSTRTFCDNKFNVCVRQDMRNISARTQDTWTDSWTQEPHHPPILRYLSSTTRNLNEIFGGMHKRIQIVCGFNPSTHNQNRKGSQQNSVSIVKQTRFAIKLFFHNLKAFEIYNRPTLYIHYPYLHNSLPILPLYNRGSKKSGLHLCSPILSGRRQVTPCYLILLNELLLLGMT